MNRRSFVRASTIGGITFGLLGVNNPAEAQLVYRKSDWKVEEFEKLVRTPARVKQVYDVTAIGEGKFLNNIKNSLNGLHYGFGIPNNDIQVVGGLHGAANLLLYDDSMWSKYSLGAWLKVTDPASGHPAMTNPFYRSRTATASGSRKEDPDNPESIDQDRSIQALQQRGVRFLSCHTALEEQARVLVKANSLSVEPEAVVQDLMKHVLPGVLIVASMVAAIALLQTDGHYSYITV